MWSAGGREGALKGTKAKQQKGDNDIWIQRVGAQVTLLPGLPFAGTVQASLLPVSPSPPCLPLIAQILVSY